ncbi:MAG: hypothetical protein GY788_06870 [bacterium]|nr:hypothetical protein [bacterium]
MAAIGSSRSAPLVPDNQLHPGVSLSRCERVPAIGYSEGVWRLAVEYALSFNRYQRGIGWVEEIAVSSSDMTYATYSPAELLLPDAVGDRDDHGGILVHRIVDTVLLATVRTIQADQERVISVTEAALADLSVSVRVKPLEPDEHCVTKRVTIAAPPPTGEP